ncbi:MAG: NTP transferase domain-containing protein [Acidobacteriota bacterium]
MSPSQEHGPGGVVLAAGFSRRMGVPKALLRIGHETFLGHWLAGLESAGVGQVRVILGRDAAAIRSRHPLPEDQVVVNPAPERGMLSSLLAGLDRLSPALPGVLLCPVDHPCVSPGEIRALLARLSPGRVVVPVHDGRRGHPVLFARELFHELRAAPPGVGARWVVRADPGRVVEVPCGPGVLVNIDTPADYRRLAELP